jgi:hemoglobin-like flavoprotein
MTETNKQLVRELLDRVLKKEEDYPELAALFYQRLFEVAPSVRPLFHNSITVQGHKFQDMLGLLRASLVRLDDMVPLLWKSGRAHQGYGAQPEHYPVVGAVLLWALERRLEPEALSSETRDAWTEFYAWVALVMQEAAVENNP